MDEDPKRNERVGNATEKPILSLSEGYLARIKTNYHLLLRFSPPLPQQQQ